MSLEDWTEGMEGLATLMEESPVGENHGTSAIPLQYGHDTSPGHLSGGSVEVEVTPSPFKPRKALNSKDHEALSATQGIVSDPREFYYLGMTAHRGVLHPDEYADYEALIFAIEMRLGFTVERIQFLYSKPNPSKADIPDKEKLEDIFLELSESGGNVVMLARILGFYVREDGYCKVMHRAIERARSRRDG